MSFSSGKIAKIQKNTAKTSALLSELQQVDSRIELLQCSATGSAPATPTTPASVAIAPSVAPAVQPTWSIAGAARTDVDVFERPQLDVDVPSVAPPPVSLLTPSLIATTEVQKLQAAVQKRIDLGDAHLEVSASLLFVCVSLI